MLKSGPHKTDTANRIDPHLHIPGEFPETPLETPGDRMQGSGGYISGAGNQQNVRPSDNTTSPRAPATHANKSDISGGNDRGSRSAAAVGALGLATAATGVKAAEKHHQREATEIEGEPTISAPPNPYTSAKIDPRVDSKPTTLDEQRFDPAVETKAPQRRAEQDAVSTSQQGTSLRNPQFHDISPQEQHHHGRNAGYVGAGAVTAGGLYYANRQGYSPTGNVRSGSSPRASSDFASQRHSQTGSIAEPPAWNPVRTHKDNMSNTVDPRTLPESGTGPYDSETFNRSGTKVDSPTQYEGHQQSGRGAANNPAVAGYGTHSTMEDQVHDPAVRGAQDPSETERHHYGKAAALGAGAGALGYGALKGGDESAKHSLSHRHPSDQVSQPLVQPASQASQFPAAQQIGRAHV